MRVNESVRVDGPPQAAFELFTDGIDRWWPLVHLSYGAERAQGIYLEPRLGGRFYERFTDGDELQVGEVLLVDAPHRIVFSWQAPDWPAPTEVEVRFTADGDGTIVAVEHRAFDRLGPDGTTMRDGFAGGWPGVLAAFEAQAAA